ncbi:MAG: hypothetical protein ACHQF2_03870, partial [Flavobacteriales bacterium]
DANGISKAAVMLGIVADQKGDKGKAKDYFKEAIDKNQSYLGEANLAIVNGKSITELRWAKKLAKESLKEAADEEASTAKATESISGISDFAADLEGKELNEIALNEGSCYYLEIENSTVYNLTTSSERELFFHKTGNEYEGTTGNGIKRGNDSKMVFKKYGFPDVVFNSQRETIMVFKGSDMIFLMEGNKVKGWIHFKLM